MVVTVSIVVVEQGPPPAPTSIEALMLRDSGPLLEPRF